MILLVVCWCTCLFALLVSRLRWLYLSQSFFFVLSAFFHARYFVLVVCFSLLLIQDWWNFMEHTFVGICFPSRGWGELVLITKYVCTIEVSSLSERSRLEVKGLVSSLMMASLLAFFQMLIVLGAGFTFGVFRRLSVRMMSWSLNYLKLYFPGSLDFYVIWRLSFFRPREHTNSEHSLSNNNVDL